MKKLIIILFSIFICVGSQAQKTAAPSQETVKADLAKGMVTFVNAVKPLYKKGQTPLQFANYVCAPWKPTNEGLSLLSKAHEFIIKGASNETILTSYNGKEMASAVLYLKKVRDVNAKSDGSELFGGKSGINDNLLASASAKEGCKWYQLWCHVQAFAQWVVDNWETIEKILFAIAAL